MFHLFDPFEKRGLLLGDGRRSGMTLLELLIAMSIMVMVVGTLGALSKGVQEGYRYTEGHGLATQHARVVLDRIGRTVREATANDKFPGAIVVATQVSSWRFPDTLAVWHPDGDPAEPDGLPRYNELVIFCPHPNEPGRLVEIVGTQDVPLSADEGNWAAQIDAIKSAGSDQAVTLTELVRTDWVTDAAALPKWRGAVRFERRLRPSAEDWAACQAVLTSSEATKEEKEAAWSSVPWVQGIYGSQTGLRQVWLRTELQLTAGETANAAGGQYVPFFGSAALYYEMHK